jgi:hypothetical protein
MPIEVSIDRKRDLVRRRISGEVSTDDMIRSFEETLRHPEYQPGMNELTDIRDHVHQTTGEDIRKVADTLKERGGFTGNVQHAIVVSRTVSYGLSRMLQMLMDDTPWEVAIFENPGEAERWLGVE